MGWIILTAFTKERAKEQSARAGEGEGVCSGLEGEADREACDAENLWERVRMTSPVA